jgi:phosphate transport system substrate-binding protein
MNRLQHLFTVGLLASALAASAETLTLSVPSTLTPLARQWASAYQAKHPGATIQVSETAVPAAIDALAQKKSDLVMLPRALRFKESEACQAALGQRPAEYKTAVNAAAVYVHKDNPVKALTYDELFDLFKGQSRDWKPLSGQEGAISVFGANTNTTAGELFAEEVLNGKGLSADVRLLSEAELRQAIAKDTNAIGFGAFASSESIRPVGIKRAFSSDPVLPSAAAITSRNYPITRFVFVYVSPAASQGEAKAFMDWVRSDEGQQLANQTGFWTLPAKWRSNP